MPSGREVGPNFTRGAIQDPPFSLTGRGSGSELGDAPSRALDLVQLAASILAREASALPSNAFKIPALSVTEVPFGGSLASGSGPDVDRLRRYGHDIVEGLLASVGVGAPPGGKGPSADDRIPLIRCAAPVKAGLEGSLSLRIANEESTASEVSLYCTELVADAGYVIPSLRVAFSPRVATIAPKSEVSFEMTIAVPSQSPSGTYSCLVQVAGSKYVKAVVSIEVN